MGSNPLNVYEMPQQELYNHDYVKLHVDVYEELHELSESIDHPLVDGVAQQGSAWAPIDSLQDPGVKLQPATAPFAAAYQNMQETPTP